MSNTHSLDAAAIDFSSRRISENNCQGQYRSQTTLTLVDIPYSPPQFLVFHHPPIVILIFPPYSSQSEVMTLSKIHLPWINFINDWTDFLKQSCEQHSVKGLKVTTRYVLYLPGRGCWFVILSTTDGSKEGCEGCEDCGVLSLHRLRAGGLLWRDSVQSSHYVAPTESSALVYLGSLLKQRCAMLCVL